MPDVMKGIECAVTRKSISFAGKYMNPDECLSIKQALDSYTFNGAAQLFMDDRIGKIEEGYYADLVVLSHDPSTVKPEEIHDIRVMMTIMDGRSVYSI